MLAALALQDVGETRSLWLYDTYQGMTPPSGRDRQFDGENAADRLAGQARVPGRLNDWAYATLEDVQLQMGTVGLGDVRYVEGPVEETIPARCPDVISLLRLDTDWYESTKH